MNIKPAAAVLAAALLLSSPAAHAASGPEIYISGRAIESTLPSAIVDGSSYMPIKALADRLGASLSWDPSSRRAELRANGLSIAARAGDKYIIANGRALYAEKGIFIQDGRLMIPCRSAAVCLNGRAEWDAVSRRVSIIPGSGYIKSGDKYYDPDELYWLSRIISSESRGEPMEGQIAVGNVVLNRVASPDYPNTIYGVIFDRNHGVQFEPVLNGTIYDAPAQNSVDAAKLCLEGVDLARGSLYFYNPVIAQSSWIGQNRPYIMTIGTHKFYS